MFISPVIEFFLGVMSASVLTDIFIVIMVVVFALAMTFKSRDRHHAFVHYTPTLLTSLGILGTFFGIIVGLLEFNPKEIDASIEVLLEGLKTAFVTSLMGMSFSIAFKVFVTFVSSNKVDELGVAEDEVDASDIYHVMKMQLESISQLKKAISENDESSLVGQFKLLRSDIADHQKANVKLTEQRDVHFKNFEDNLWLKLQQFADMMSKSATEQVVEALNQVITDFNKNLTEQFGENFKQLNIAVAELVTWQENYKSQLGDMKAQYEHGVQSITQTQASVEGIGQQLQSIPESMNSLRAVMEVNQHQIEELSRHLESFRQVSEKAVQAVPDIRAQVDLAIAGAKQASDELAKGIIMGAEQYRDAVDSTRGALVESAQATANASEQIKVQFSDAIVDINNHMRTMISDLLTNSKSVNDNFKQAASALIEETTGVSKVFVSSIENMRVELEKSIKRAAEENASQSERIFSSMDDSIRENIKKNGDAMLKQIENLDEALEQEIRKVLQGLANGLAGITEHMVNEYEKMARVNK